MRSHQKNPGNPTASTAAEIRAPWIKAVAVCLRRMTPIQREAAIEEVEAICVNEFSVSLGELPSSNAAPASPID